jgi:RimJ/RimL family protein N-acetyltransferase
MGRGTSHQRQRAEGPPPISEMAAASGHGGIQTERLVLRPFRADDFEDYFSLSADPETFRYSERGPMNREEAWGRLLRQTGHWALNGYGMFVIEDKASGRFAGETGLCDFRRSLGASFDSVPESAWAIAAWARGRGYATEAAQAAIDWIEAWQGIERTVCLIHASNQASLNVARKLNYHCYGRREYHGFPALLHHRDCPE